jgi:hypothetical protein
MLNEIAEICLNCEHSDVKSNVDYCVCKRKKPMLVRPDGKCKYFSVDLLKFEMPLPIEVILDDVEI